MVQLSNYMKPNIVLLDNSNKGVWYDKNIEHIIVTKSPVCVATTASIAGAPRGGTPLTNSGGGDRFGHRPAGEKKLSKITKIPLSSLL